MKLLLVIVVTFFSMLNSAWGASPNPQKMRVIPSSSISKEAGYLSTALLLNPCLDIQTTGYSKDADTLQLFTDARNSLPLGACDDPALVEKIFKTRFLQYASLTLVNDPWNLGTKIAAQEQAINHCRDTRCLERELDLAISALTPIYLGAPDPKWPNGHLCSTESVRTLSSVLTEKARKKITAECGGVDPESVYISICKDSHGKLVSAICQMQGNQVNAPQWLFRKKEAGEKLLLYTDNGPSGALETTCNGMPDLMTAARMNLGEHSYTYYRFDGSRYQAVYGYTAMSIGNDGRDGYFSIAQGAGIIQNTVVCR